MVDTKITDLTMMNTQPASNDVFVVVDVSDPSMATSGTTKSVTFANAIEGFVFNAIAGKSNIRKHVAGLDKMYAWNKIASQQMGKYNQKGRISVFGQSFVQATSRFMDRFTSYLKNDYRDGGVGFFGFARATSGSASTTDGCSSVGYVGSRTGTWTDVYGTSQGMNLSHITSSVANSVMTITSPLNPTPLGSFRLFWQGGSSSASVQWRLNTTINGSITGIIINNGGMGYSNATVQIIGDGKGATATAIISAGVITAINITNGGKDYTNAQIIITGNGSNANASATITNVTTTGTYASITLSAGLNQILSTSRTASSGEVSSYSFDINVVSGTANLIGIDLQSPTTNYGLVVHKFGCAGATVGNFLVPDETQWVNGLSNFDTDLAVLVFGGNDANKKVNTTSTQFAENLTTFINRIRLAETKKIDVLVVIVPQNGRIVYDPNNPTHVSNLNSGDGVLNDQYNTEPLSAYANAAFNVCETLKCGFINLQNFFGEQFTDYCTTTNTSIALPAYTASNNPLYQDDNVHPFAETGGAIMANVLYRALSVGVLTGSI